MRRIQQHVREFHDVSGIYTPPKPLVPSASIKELRKRLISEEVGETLRAIDEDDLVGVADGIADAVYVLLGTACSYGIDMGPIWEAVQNANMSKFPPCPTCKGNPLCATCEGFGRIVLRREDGKILKPEGWAPPDIEGLLEAQARR